MRIVTWNCQQGLGRKKAVLATLDPDVAVLCEVTLANPFEQSVLEESVSWHAVGSLAARGLAIAGFRPGFERRPLREDAGRWAVGVSGGGVGILGIWSVPGPGRSYGAEVLGIVEANAEWIAGGDVLVAGDLNAGGGLGAGGRKRRSSRLWSAGCPNSGSSAPTTPGRASPSARRRR